MLSRKATKYHNEVSRWRSITAKLDHELALKEKELKVYKKGNKKEE